MALDPNKASWVERVLGVALSAATIEAGGHAGVTAPTETGPGPGVEAKTEPKPESDTERVESITLARLGKCRLIWTQTVNNVHNQVESLKGTVLSAMRASQEYDEDEMDEVEEAIQELDDMVSGIDLTLLDFVDRVINADPGPTRTKAQQAAIDKADEFAKFVTSDPDFALVDKNEYLSTNIKALTLGSLTAIRKELTGVG